MQQNKVTREQIITSLVWKLLERTGTQGIQFVIQIILARLLMPNDYGIIALIAVFITFSNVLVQSGFTVALIQKKDVSETDYSSVFYLCLGAAGICYVALFYAAPAIAAFYSIPQIVSVLRVLSLALFPGAVNGIQNAIVSKTMQFKKVFFSSLGAASLSGTMGIILAYQGFGVWALVAQQLINQFMITVILWATVKWRPEWEFSFGRAKTLFSFGWKLLASSLIDNLYMNLRSLIIGKIYNPTMLGFYHKGEQFPQALVSNINGSIQSVMLPALSLEQDNRQRVKEIMRRSIITSSFMVFPLMIGLAVAAEPLVRVLLTDKWLPCVPFLRILSLSYALWPIHTANLQAINALGRSDIFLKLEMIKKTMGMVILAVSMAFGVYAVAMGALLTGIISTFINAWPNRRLLNYSYQEQWKDMMPSLLLSLFMGGWIFSMMRLPLPPWLTLILQFAAGTTIYIGLAKVFKLEAYIYAASVVSGYLHHGKEAVR